MLKEKERYIGLNTTEHSRIFKNPLKKTLFDRLSSKDPTVNFPSNSIHTGRYTLLTFLPLQLYAQFSKFANLYFLFICMLQLVPNWSPTGQYTTIFPLSLFVTISMLREGYDDYKRHLHDRTENTSKTYKLRPKKTSFVSTLALGRRNSMHRDLWEECTWKSLKVGDIVKLVDKDPVPADILILSTTNPNGVCYIETANLDGETNLKMRQAPHLTQQLLEEDFTRITSLKGKITAEKPSGNLYDFEGVLGLAQEEKIPLSIDQLLLRGSNIRNTKQVYGVVIYTGEETRLRKNATKVTKAKKPTLELITNVVVAWMFTIVIILAIVNTAAHVLWEDYKSKGHWYLEGRTKSIAEIFFSSIILYNALIPLSLYVTMEIVKMVQVWMMNNDLEMYDAKRDIPAQSFTSSLNEELGQVRYLFTDKTGTLTENLMEFQKFSINGKSFSMNRRYTNKMNAAGSSRSLAFLGGYRPRETTVVDEYYVPMLKDLYKRRTPEQEPYRAFLEALALCHTVVPEFDEKVKPIPHLDFDLPALDPEYTQIVYQASSPDEVALINAARNLGYVLIDRNPNQVFLNILGADEDSCFEILNIIPFSSARRRSSIIYRTPDGKIVMYCKGADSVILPKIKNIDSNFEKLSDHVDSYAAEGLRTLVYARKFLTKEQYEPWAAMYAEASTSLENRQHKIEMCAEDIEIDFELLGATAIEDKLQSKVPDTIKKLRRANIKVWMLTGDKKETAVNIGVTCKLIAENSQVIFIGGDSIEQLKTSLELAKERIDELRPTEFHHHHIVLVIEGGSLSILQNTSVMNLSAGEELSSNPLLVKFLARGMEADNVICCRFSPSQKALVVRGVKEIAHVMLDTGLELRDIESKWPDNRDGMWHKMRSVFRFAIKESTVTLAIGDGANDIPMIQSANVGIGITGREGLAAARASDYAIAQFRFLQTLLFVHGRWNYLRLSLFTLGTFYRCIVFYCCQGLFQGWTGFSGTSVFEQWTLACYSIFFSSFSVVAVGIFEKDLDRNVLISVPELYRFGQRHMGFSFKIFWTWMLQGVWHMICALMTVFIFMGNFIDDRNNLVSNVFTSDASGQLQESSIYVIGTFVYTNVIILITLKIGYLESSNWTIFTHLSAFASLGLWYLWHGIYSNFTWPYIQFLGYDAVGMWKIFTNVQFQIWLVAILCVGLGIIICDFASKSVSWLWNSGVFDGEMWVSPKIGPQSQSSAQQVAKKLQDIDDDHWTTAIEWWQQWQKYHPSQ